MAEDAELEFSAVFVGPEGVGLEAFLCSVFLTSSVVLLGAVLLTAVLLVVVLVVLLELFVVRWGGGCGGVGLWVLVFRGFF